MNKSSKIEQFATDFVETVLQYLIKHGDVPTNEAASRLKTRFTEIQEDEEDEEVEHGEIPINEARICGPSLTEQLNTALPTAEDLGLTGSST